MDRFLSRKRPREETTAALGQEEQAAEEEVAQASDHENEGHQGDKRSPAVAPPTARPGLTGHKTYISAGSSISRTSAGSGGITWDQVDPAVLDELPPDVQADVRRSMGLDQRSRKGASRISGRSSAGPRGGIARYFAGAVIRDIP